MRDTLKVERAIKGDEKAFKELIDEHGPYLYRIAYSLCKYSEDAKDIYQETVYKAFRGIKNLKNPEAFKVWIKRILINTASSYLEKVGMVEVKYEEGYIKEDKNEIKIDLSKAIDTLDEKYKKVIILRYYEDLKVDDIANTLELNPNTVKTYIAKAIKDMKKLLKEDYLNEEK